MKYVLIVLLIFSVFIAIVLSIAIPIAVVNGKYRRFVVEHSQALKKLTEINDKYYFKPVKDYDLSHSYDNENYYDTISPEDYLIYQLVHIKNDVIGAMSSANDNKNLFESYKSEVASECKPDIYDIEVPLKNRKKLKRYENNIFASKIKRPVISFSISVYLRLEKINGAYVRSKSAVFYPIKIKSLIDRVKSQSYGYYTDQEIWDSICRVERGKVSNKLRFAVYDRDHWRCCKCGRRTNDLEIDHIVPIAKGGKTTIDNLQTLCHRCNKEKGKRTEYYK